MEHLRRVADHVRERVPGVPILIAGNGDRLLTVGAQRADIIGFTGGAPIGGGVDPFAERVGFVRDAAGARFDALELNIAITAMPTDRSGVPDLRITRRFLPDLSDEELLRTPAVLSGSPGDIADTLRGYLDAYGVSYIIAQAPHADAFADVIAELR